MPCAHPKPFPPAAALLCAFTLCIGLGLLVAGLREPDRPLLPIRTASDQTPIAWTPRPTTTVIATAPPFVSVATPRSSFYVSVETYALLSPCGLYEPPLPDQVLIQNARAGKNPVPNCAMAPTGH